MLPVASRAVASLVVLALGLLLTTAGTTHAAPLFKAPFLMFEPGPSPTSVAIADLNEDGRPDLAVTYGGDAPPAVAVLLGNGDGTFGSPTDFEVGRIPRAVRVADLNGDGHLDLAVANRGHVPDSPSTITVLLGHGDGTVAPRADFDVEMDTRALAIADLDGDGDLDLVTEKSVLLGKGDGTFGSKIGFGDLSDRSAAVGDLDGDGRLDVVTVNGYIEPGDEDDGLRAISVRLGNGDGTFAAAARFGTGYRPSAVALADLNSDGHPDVAAANWGSSPQENGYVSVFLGNGDGTLGPQRRFNTGNNPSSIAIADLDSDGQLDIATSNYGDDPDFDSNTITVLLGNGDGTFRDTPELNVGENPASIAIGDVDGNGALDLVTADETSHTVSVVLGNGNGTFGIPEYGAGQRPRSLAAADLDGDGSMDLAVANIYSSTLSVLLGNGDGTLGVRAEFATGSLPYSVAISDLNADGRPDLVVANWVDYAEPSGTLSVLLGNGDGTFQAKNDYPAGTRPGSVVAADLNADGRMDLAVANTPVFSSTNTVSVLLGNGDGTFRPRTEFGTVGGRSLAVVDLDEDNRLDIVTANHGSPSVSVLLGNGDGTFRPGADVVTNSFGSGSQAMAVADLDADGHTDVVAEGFALLGNGYGTFASPIAFTNGAPEFMAIADFDTDGRVDLATASPDFNNLTGEVRIMLGNGDGTFAHQILFGTSRFPHSPVAADFDADGRPDLAVANFRSNSVSVLLNQTGDQPTPTLLSLVSAHVARDRVELTWSDPSGDVSGAIVYRRTVPDDWQARGNIWADGTGRLLYQDVSSVPGTRYGYRLGVMEAGREVYLGETWVDVPVASKLALAGFRSNPVHDDRSVAFSLVDASPARLELFDVGGRKIAAREVGALGAGSHLVTLGEGRTLTPGVYLLRLTQGSRSIMARSIVVR